MNSRFHISFYLDKTVMTVYRINQRLPQVSFVIIATVYSTQFKQVLVEVKITLVYVVQYKLIYVQ